MRRNATIGHGGDAVVDGVVVEPATVGLAARDTSAEYEHVREQPVSQLDRHLARVPVGYSRTWTKCSEYAHGGSISGLRSPCSAGAFLVSEATEIGWP